MYEIRFHGRGGQGGRMAAEAYALAAFLEGNYAVSFPFFGAERRGALKREGISQARVVFSEITIPHRERSTPARDKISPELAD